MTSDIDPGAVFNPTVLLGIALALLGAILMSLGAQYQNRGVHKVGTLNKDDGAGGLSLRSIKSLLSRPSWVIGTALLILAGVPQVTALAITPLIVVQPIGAASLVITAIMNARISKISLNSKVIWAIAMSITGVAVFVTVAAGTAVESEVTDAQLINLLIVLVVLTAGVGLSFLFFRKHFGPISYMLSAGILYGVAAALTKVVLLRLMQWNLEPLTFICFAGLGISIALGMYFIQTAHASGPPDLVIAGLTVIDPLVAILISSIVLGETAQAPLGAIVIFFVAGSVAILGVYLIAKHHPQMGSLTKLKNRGWAADTGSIPVIDPSGDAKSQAEGSAGEAEPGQNTKPEAEPDN